MSPRQKFLPGSYHDPQEEQNYSFTQNFLRKSNSLHSQQKEGRGSYEIYKGISLATIRNGSTFLFQKTQTLIVFSLKRWYQENQDKTQKMK